MSKRTVLAGLALIVLVWLVYQPVNQCGFIWDDDDYLLKNGTLRSSDGLIAIWANPSATPQYYPLVFTSFWLEYQAWQLWAPGYHLVNLALHTANTLLLWLVLYRLQIPGAWLAAALFGLHPVHVESVAWITERKNVLSAFFYFLSLLTYLRFSPLETEAKRQSWAWYFLSLGFFLCALASKTVTCSLPAVILLLIWWKRGWIRWNDLIPLLPFFVVGLASGLFTAWWERTHVGAVGREYDLSFLQRFLLAGRVLCFYSEKLILPLNLIFIYPRWTIDATVAWQYLFPVVVIGLFSILWLTRNRIGRGPLVAMLCFAGTLFPALGFFNIYPFRYSFVADHFQYLASAGFLALMSNLVVQFGGVSKLASKGIALLLIVAFSALTYFQCSTYIELESLYLDILDKNPDCWMAHHNLGHLYLEQMNDPKTALQHLKIAYHLKPDDFNVLGDLGKNFMDLNLLDEAEVHFRKFVTEFPDRAKSHSALGYLLFRKGKNQEAMLSFQRALEIDPTEPISNLKMGQLLIKQGQIKEAIPYLLKADSKSPMKPEVYFEIGSSLEEAGDSSLALQQYRKMVAANPHDARWRFSLALALQRAGLTDESRQQMVEASQDPGWIHSALPTVWVLATNPDKKSRNGQLAYDLSRFLLATYGPRPEVLVGLAAALAEMGRFNDAIITATKALEGAKANKLINLEKQLLSNLQSYQNKQPIRENK